MVQFDANSPLQGAPMFQGFQCPEATASLAEILREIPCLRQPSLVDLLSQLNDPRIGTLPIHFQALHLYTSPAGLYKIINKNLRERGHDLLDLRPLIWLVDEALRQLPSEHVLVAFRGLSHMPDPDRFNRSRIGDIFTFTQFTSMSHNLKQAFMQFCDTDTEIPEQDAPYMMYLYPLFAKDVAAYSHIPEEQELVCRSCSRWKLLSGPTLVEENVPDLGKRKFYKIELEEVPAAPLFQSHTYNLYHHCDSFNQTPTHHKLAIPSQRQELLYQISATLPRGRIADLPTLEISANKETWCKLNEEDLPSGAENQLRLRTLEPPTVVPLPPHNLLTTPSNPDTVDAKEYICFRLSLNSSTPFFQYKVMDNTATSLQFNLGTGDWKLFWKKVTELDWTGLFRADPLGTPTLGIPHSQIDQQGPIHCDGYNSCGWYIVDARHTSNVNVHSYCVIFIEPDLLLPKKTARDSIEAFFYHNFTSVPLIHMVNPAKEVRFPLDDRTVVLAPTRGFDDPRSQHDMFWITDTKTCVVGNDRDNLIYTLKSRFASQRQWWDKLDAKTLDEAAELLQKHTQVNPDGYQFVRPYNSYWPRDSKIQWFKDISQNTIHSNARTTPGLVNSRHVPVVPMVGVGVSNCKGINGGCAMGASIGAGVGTVIGGLEWIWAARKANFSGPDHLYYSLNTMKEATKGGAGFTISHATLAALGCATDTCKEILKTQVAGIAALGLSTLVMFSIEALWTLGCYFLGRITWEECVTNLKVTTVATVVGAAVSLITFAIVCGPLGAAVCTGLIVGGILGTVVSLGIGALLSRQQRKKYKYLRMLGLGDSAPNLGEWRARKERIRSMYPEMTRQWQLETTKAINFIDSWLVTKHRGAKLITAVTM